MLTAKEVGTMLAISARAVYDIPDDQLPRYRMGAGRGAVRFDLQDVEAYRTACRSTATRRAIVGATSSAALLTDADSALQSYFRQRGIAPKPKHSPASKTRASTPLRLAHDATNR
jgi:predicted DNA-binding transcriptional regulator AlpA